MTTETTTPPAGDPPVDPVVETPPAGDPPAGDPPSVAERPDFIPEKFWDAEKGEPRLEGLAKSYAELERTRGNVDALKQQWEEERLSVRPAAPDDYTLPEIEAFDPEALAASPIVNVWRQAAHEAGMSQEGFEKVLGTYAEVEVARMAEQYQAEVAKLGENAKARTEAVGLWAKKTFGETPEFDAIAAVATSAAGVQALEKLMSAMSDKQIGGGDGDPPLPDGDTKKDIDALMASKEYWSPQHRDPAVVARVEAFFKKQYGKS